MNITLESVSLAIATASTLELVVAIVATIVATILLFRLLFASKGQSLPRPDLALFLGASGAGKSALFYHWSMPGSQVKTVTSQSPNRGRVLQTCPLEIIDFPGHASLWHGAVALLPRAGRIVYLIDATADTAALKAIAENLFDLLTAKALRSDTRLMICRSKTDAKAAKSESAILKILNSELELLRNSRAKALDASEANWLGVDDEKFDLKSHCPVDVTFGESSVKTGNVVDIETFLQ